MRLPPLALLLLAFAVTGCSDPGDPGAAGDGTPSASSSSSSGSPTRAAVTHEVVMRDNLFDPADLTVHVGDTVHWTTEDPQAHNVVSESEAARFRSEDVSTIPAVYASDFSYTFETAGTVDYLCEYHSGMVGTIVVG